MIDPFTLVELSKPITVNGEQYRVGRNEDNTRAVVMTSKTMKIVAEFDNEIEAHQYLNDMRDK